MRNADVIIVGGGASGMLLASKLPRTKKIILLERGDRLGKKLSATGNGQGNLTNLNALNAEYFTTENNNKEKIFRVLKNYDNADFCAYLQTLGLLWASDDKGRVYPAGRQASAVTDALRFLLAARGVEVRLKSLVVALEKADGGFIVRVDEDGEQVAYLAKNVVLCAGGKAAKNFGTDGTAYALAKGFGHSVTDVYPSLVQLKTETAHIKTLKGIRVNNGKITAEVDGKPIYSTRGDIIFTDYGVSGDAVFRVSAFVADKLGKNNVRVVLDFLPDFTKEDVLNAFAVKEASLPTLEKGELLFGIVNNQVGRAVFKRANGNKDEAAALVKAFPLQVTGSLGFDYAQVTKGGVCLSETDETLQSVFASGLYFAGEILDVDGQCGGYNLQWAYSSASTVAKAIENQDR